MRLNRSLWSFLALLVLPSSTWALHPDSRPPRIDYETYELQEEVNAPLSRFEAAAMAKMVPGVCYSPFHNAEYPLVGGNIAGLDNAIFNDFALMKNYFSVVRTYYSSYFGINVAKPAAENGVKLFLGVFMTSESWWRSQYDAAIAAVNTYPSTVSAILVGNENIAPAGPYSPGDVSARISDLRGRLRAETGRTVPIGTVQRATEWLDASKRAEMLALANNCDIIGVNIYPFFDSNYNANVPLAILNGVWDQMVAVYGETKLRLTEVGFPTAGAPSSYAPLNIPSITNSKNFYNAFVNWNPSKGGNEAFWFMFFDRRPDDNTMQAELEKYFGFFTHDKKTKAADYPVLLSALAQAGSRTATSTVTTTTQPPVTAAPPPTTTRPPTTTPPSTTTRPVTTAPPPATTRPATTSLRPATTPPPAPTTPAPTTARLVSIVYPSSTNVCRVRKAFP